MSKAANQVWGKHTRKEFFAKVSLKFKGKSSGDAIFDEAYDKVYALLVAELKEKQAKKPLPTYLIIVYRLLKYLQGV
jgi:hypothetical protein